MFKKMLILHISVFTFTQIRHYWIHNFTLKYLIFLNKIKILIIGDERS